MERPNGEASRFVMLRHDSLEESCLMKHFKDPRIQSPRSFDEPGPGAIEERIINHPHSPLLYCPELPPPWALREEFFARERSRSANTEHDELRIERTNFFERDFPAWTFGRERKRHSPRNPQHLRHPISGDHRRIVPFFDVDMRMTREC